MKMIYVILFCIFSLNLFAQDGAIFLQKEQMATAAAISEPHPSILEPMRPELEAPFWLKTAINTVAALPIIGTPVVLLMQWLGVLGSIMTALTGFLLIALKALNSVMTVAQLSKAAQIISSLEKSKLIYWMKYFSLFNAEKNK